MQPQIPISDNRSHSFGLLVEVCFNGSVLTDPERANLKAMLWSAHYPDRLFPGPK